MTEFNKRLIYRLRFRFSLAQGNILISVGKIRDEPIFVYTSNAIILKFFNQDIIFYSIKGLTEIKIYTTRKLLAFNSMLNQVNDASDSMIRGVICTETKLLAINYFFPLQNF